MTAALARAPARTAGHGVDALFRTPAAPNYLLVPRPPSKRLLILFSGSSVPPHVFHWWNIGQEVGCNVLYVNNGVNQWYHYGVPGLGGTLDETIATIRAWGDAHGVEDYLTIGGSMGGHGAILFGLKLDARILAFGFESKIMLEGSRSLKLTPPGFTPPFTDLKPLIARSRHRIIAYIGDSDPIDLFTADAVKDLDTLHLVTLRRVGHGPPAHMKKRGRLQGVIDAFMRNEPQPVQPDASDTLTTEGYPQALYDAHCGYWARDLERWEAGARRAVSLRKDSEEGFHLLGRALLRRGEPEAAERCLAAAIAIKPLHREARFYRGAALRAAGRLREALAVHADTAETWPDYALPHFDSGIAYLALGDLKAALDAFARAAAIDPANAKAAQRLKSTRLLWAAALKKAQPLFEDGKRLIADRRFAEAEPLFARAAELRPDLRLARHHRARCLRELGRPREALDLLLDLLAIWPNDAGSLREAGAARLDLGDVGGAIASLEAAVALTPDNKPARALLKRARALAGRRRVPA